MALDVFYTDSHRVLKGALRGAVLDCAFGSGENDFELTVGKGTSLEVGAVVCVPGTEYGGVVDEVAPSDDGRTVSYKGRSFHGVLVNKVVCPDAGADYLTVSGDANKVLASLVSRLSIGGLFSVPGAESGISISGYRFKRYTDAYSGICDMLSKAGARLDLEWSGASVAMRAVAVSTVELRSDVNRVSIDRRYRPVNHLVCLGKGELRDRDVVHLYADASGKVSQAQTFSGLDEVEAVYDYSNAESDELRSKGIEQLEGYQTASSADITDLDMVGDRADVGDVLHAIDPDTGAEAYATVAKKTVKIAADGTLSVSYDTGTAQTVTQSSQVATTSDVSASVAPIAADVGSASAAASAARSAAESAERKADEAMALAKSGISADAVAQSRWQPFLLGETINSRDKSVMKPLVLMHVTDLHGDRTSTQLAQDWYSAHSGEVDAVVCTGDMVQDSYGDGRAFFDAVVGTGSWMRIPGNHDWYAGDGGWKSMADVRSMWLSDAESSQGVTIGDGVTYWYRDFASSSVRIIGFDLMVKLRGTSDQWKAEKSWLSSTLGSARTAGLAVLVLVHFAQPDGVPSGTPWTSALMHPSAENDVFPTELADAVQAYTDAGGVFCGFLAGHTHFDYFTRSASHPLQVCACMTCTSSWWSAAGCDDMDRSLEPDKWAADIVTVDVYTHTVSVQRVGAHRDKLMREKDGIGWSMDDGILHSAADAGAANTSASGTASPTAWTYLYGDGSNGTQFCRWRTCGILAELQWRFSQETTNEWVAGSIPATARPSAYKGNYFCFPGVALDSSGNVIDGVTADAWVGPSNGNVSFQMSKGVSGAYNAGTAHWIIGG